MVKWQQIVDAVATLSDDRIQSVELFDVYRGPGVPDRQRVCSVSLQDPHGTLDDQAIQELVDQVVCVSKECCCRIERINTMPALTKADLSST